MRSTSFKGVVPPLLVVLGAVLAGQVAAADIEAGKKAFIKCQVCHSAEKDVSKIGPSLHGVFGRKAGTLASFPGYSDQMKASGVVWDEKTIVELIKNPRVFIPGTKMLFLGLKSDAEIANLLAYLKSVNKPVNKSADKSAK